MTANTLILIIYCLTGGIVIAFIWSLITKIIYGKLIDALVREDCENEQTAKGLEELRIKKNFLLSFSLREGKTLSKLISRAEGERYYLLPEKKLKAQCLYGRERVSIITVITTFLLFAAIMVICTYLVPLIFN